MIVRARLRAVEEMPDNILCCPAMVQALRDEHQNVVLVESVGTIPCPPGYCAYCKTPSPLEGKPGKIGIARGPNGRKLIFPLFVYDVDEGPYDPSLPLDVVSYTADARPAKARDAARGIET